ncbi:MAG: hypothetical protein N2316_01090, partial [Spirochaetes bacterium]|nr:hypothetical protein [Spirochaetota bacterium]
GKLCKDGMYFIKMQVTKDEINFATTLQKSIIIDSTPPRGSIHFSLKEFTPDDDCYKDQIIIHPYAIDKYSVEKWEVNVFDNNGEIIKKFMGSSGVPKALRWNGRLRDGSIPFTFEKFNVQFTAWDKAGNEMQTLNDTFSTGLVVALEGNQQHIVFSNEGIFRNDNEDATLLRFLRVLGRKIRYLAPEKVHIEVHSDFEGDDDVNLLKTEKVAAFVKDFLVSYGIDEKIISFRGMGETKPLYPEGSGKLRNKNNRIEIFLHYGN